MQLMVLYNDYIICVKILRIVRIIWFERVIQENLGFCISTVNSFLLLQEFYPEYLSCNMISWILKWLRDWYQCMNG